MSKMFLKPLWNEVLQKDLYYREGAMNIVISRISIRPEPKDRM